MTELVLGEAAAYAEAHTTPPVDQLREVAEWTQSHTRSPGMMSGVPEARLLQALIVVGGARTVLEIGTFTGFGALAMAAALPADGRVTTLEVDQETAAIARGHIEGSPHAERIDLIVGDARETLQRLEGPFDLVYIDAWKPDYPAYLAAVVSKLAERGVIVADNLLRRGDVLDGDTEDPGVLGLREFAQRVQDDDRLDNVLLTVGDGLMLAWRRPGSASLPAG